jgi:hypothetical protein
MTEEEFDDQLRPSAFAIAYRMLGSVSEAEDADCSSWRLSDAPGVGAHAQRRPRLSRGTEYVSVSSVMRR